MKIPKSLVYILAIIGSGYVLLIAIFSFIPMCKTSEIRMAISPSNQHGAKIVVEMCPKQAEPKLELSIFDIATPDHTYSTTLANATTTDVELTWLSDNRLQVLYPPSLQLAQEPFELNGVEIKFVINPNVKPWVSTDIQQPTNSQFR